MLQPRRSSAVPSGISGSPRRACRRRCCDLRLYGGMAVARALDAGQDGRSLQAAGRRAARPSQEPCQGHLLHGRLRSERRRIGLSRAQVFAAGQYPALGRFNLGTPNPDAPDATVRVRGMALRISPPDGQEWRGAMINAPVFPVSTPQGFYELLQAAGSKAPDAMKTFIAAHPEFAALRRMGHEGPLDRQLCGGTLQQPQQLHLHRRFRHGSRGALVAAAGGATGCHLARGSRQARPRRSRAGDHRAGRKRAAALDAGGDLANPGDPTADPTKAWPEDRRTVEVGTLIVQKIEAEADGPCRDINFDPTVLPAGIRTSDDPFPAARSAAYARSYDLRTAEAKDYPRTATDAQP